MINTSKNTTAIGLILLLFGALMQAATGTIMPSPYQTVFDSNGNPVSGACVWTYTAGTSTAAATYTDSALASPNTNPILADPAGRFVAFLRTGSSYKFTFETACVSPAHGSVIKTVDNVATVPGTGQNVDLIGVAGENIAAGKVAYLNAFGTWNLADSGGAAFSTTPIVGIAIDTITTGNSGTFRLEGQVTGLSSLTIGGVYYVSTVGTMSTTAPTNARILGTADSTTSLVLDPNMSDRPPILQDVFSTGSQNNFTLTNGVQLIRVANASLLTFTGFAAGYDGQRIRFVSIGAGQIDFVNQSASSTAANRLINFATSGNTSLAAGVGTADFVYDLTTARWRMTAHEQGDWITPTFAAGSYTGSGTLTWTLTAGDVTTQAYWLRGRRLTVAFTLDTTSTGGVASTDLRIGNAAWGSFTASTGQFNGSIMLALDAGVVTPAYAQINGSGTAIRILKQTPGNWSNAAANTTTAYGLMEMGVQ